MKNNAGIKISNIQSLMEYSQMYLKAFEKSTNYCIWEKHSGVYPIVKQSHNFITTNFKKDNSLFSISLEVYNYIHHKSIWTEALRGKRLLIISSFIDSIKEKESNFENIYGRDLFPECSFVYLKPPQTNGVLPSKEF